MVIGGIEFIKGLPVDTGYADENAVTVAFTESGVSYSFIVLVFDYASVKAGYENGDYL